MFGMFNDGLELFGLFNDELELDRFLSVSTERRRTFRRLKFMKGDALADIGNLDDTRFAQFCAALGECESLSQLWDLVANVDITRLQQLGSALQKCERLRLVFIAETNIGSWDVARLEVLGVALANIPKLDTLNLSKGTGFPITQSELRAFIGTLAKASHLETIFLGQSLVYDTQDDEFEFVIQQLLRLRNLSTVDLPRHSREDLDREKDSEEGRKRIARREYVKSAVAENPRRWQKAEVLAVCECFDQNGTLDIARTVAEYLGHSSEIIGDVYKEYRAGKLISSPVNLFFSPVLIQLRQMEGEFLTEHRHEDPRLQEQYDRRFGLVPYKTR